MTILSQTESTTLDQLLDIPRANRDQFDRLEKPFLQTLFYWGDPRSFGEKERIRLALDRFRENGLTDATDEFGNASGIPSGNHR